MRRLFFLACYISIFLKTEELLIALIKFDKNLQQVSLKFAISSPRKQPTARKPWKSKIDYPVSKDDILVQIITKPIAVQYSLVTALEDELKKREDSLPSLSRIEKAADQGEEAVLGFKPLLEEYRKLLFAYHYRANKNIEKEASFERVYLAATQFYDRYLERYSQERQWMRAEKIAQYALNEARAELNKLNNSIDTTLRISTWKTTGLTYLEKNQSELSKIKTSIEKAKKIAPISKAKEFDVLLDRVFALELKVKNAIDEIRVLQKEKNEKPVDIAAELAQRRIAIKGEEDDEEESEDSDWLD